MKMKSLAMLAMSGFVAASVAYVAPALADDASTGQAMQSPADNAMQSPGDNNGGQSGNAQNNVGSAQDMSSPSSNSDDAGSPDTATGDDDY